MQNVTALVRNISNIAGSVLRVVWKGMVKNLNKKKKVDWKRWIPFYIMGLPGMIYLIGKRMEQF